MQIHTHQISGQDETDLNGALTIQSLDKPGDGGAHHEYLIDVAELGQLIKFQKGPLKEAGLNGISNESLLAIVAHRLECFQAGDFSCRENAIALTKIQEALMWLHKRTMDRIGRGVEGTSKK